MDKEMNAAEQYALDQANKIMAQMMARAQGALCYEDGTPVEFNLKPGRHMYLFYEDRRTDIMYAYTPWKDTRGWYWVFNYVPKESDESGETTRWTIKKAVKLRKRKTAAGRALARFEKATGGH